jgi:uncharacterized protein (TIGR03435 family)
MLGSTVANCIALFCYIAFSQSAEVPPRFEADIRPSANNVGVLRIPRMRGPFVHDRRYEVRNATMVDLIRTAYRVDPDLVVGGPTWLEEDRFDVNAVISAGLTAEGQQSMLQALLAERFQLVVHHDTQPVPAYALTVGKHLTLKRADKSGDSGCRLLNGTPQPGGQSVVTGSVVLYSCRNVTMAAFADGMRTMDSANGYLDSKQVLDHTGLNGAWSFEFKYTSRGATTSAEDTITIFDAVKKQLGLQLDIVKAPMSVVVVDKVNRTPTPNLPADTEHLRGDRTLTEFEVADVKPSPPDQKRMKKYQILPGGRLNVEGATLQFLIEQAWTITDEALAEAPNWLDTDRFTIVGKATTTDPSGQPIDTETVKLMLRGLLAKRFNLVTHIEDRPVPAYSLVAVKPKLRKADPLSRTEFKLGPGPDGKDPRNANPMLFALWTFQNVTMAQFAERLPTIGAGYIHRRPVLDETGLEGGWNFTLCYSAAIMLLGRGGIRSPAQSPVDEPLASEPTGGISLFDALEKQLGLKLVLEKHPMPVLVIDHVERKPTDN